MGDRVALGVEGVREESRGGITPVCGTKKGTRVREFARWGRELLKERLGGGRNVSVVIAVAKGYCPPRNGDRSPGR